MSPRAPTDPASAPAASPTPLSPPYGPFPFPSSSFAGPPSDAP